VEIRVVAYYGDIHVYSFKATESRNERQLIPNPNPIRKDVRKGKDTETIFRIYPASPIRLSTISLGKSTSLKTI